MKLLIHYLSKHKKTVLLALLMAIINQGAAFLDPLITGKIVDGLISNRDQLTQAEFIEVMAIMVGLAFVAVTIARLANNYQDAYTNMIVKKVGTNIYADGLRHAMAMPYFEFEDQSSGETIGILNKVRGDLENFITSFISVFLISLIGLVFVVVYSLTVSYQVTIVYLTAVPVISIISWLLSKRMKRLQEHIMDKSSILNGKTTEVLHNIELIKSLGLTNEQIGHLGRHNNRILDLEVMKIKLNRKLGFYQGTMVNVVRSMMMVVLLLLIFKGALSAGQYFTFLLYSMFLFNPLQELGNVLKTGREAQVSLKQLSALLEKPFEKRPEAPEQIEQITSLAFDKVSFSYPGNNGGLREVSFIINKGDTVAFVGPSGSGKSTIVKLLLRLYTPESGIIYFNGTRARILEKDDIRNRTGIVTQETQLFSGTISENLKLVNAKATDQECMEVLEKAACKQLVERAENKLHTLIGESGMKISGGERQRLAIARALMRRPDILIFDEATSALDSITEKEITRTMRELSGLGEHMTVMIAHRLSTIKHADRIFVLEEGSIVEEGGHQELLDKKGLYFALWRQQTGSKVSNEIDE